MQVLNNHVRVSETSDLCIVAVSLLHFERTLQAELSVRF